MSRRGWLRVQGCPLTYSTWIYYRTGLASSLKPILFTLYTRIFPFRINSTTTAGALVLFLINLYCDVILVRIELFSIIYVTLIKSYVKYAHGINAMSHFQALQNGIFYKFYSPILLMVVVEWTNGVHNLSRKAIPALDR